MNLECPEHQAVVAAGSASFSKNLVMMPALKLGQMNAGKQTWLEGMVILTITDVE